MRVVGARDGRRGIELVRALHPAIVVLDIASGWTVGRSSSR